MTPDDAADPKPADPQPEASKSNAAAPESSPTQDAGPAQRVLPRWRGFNLVGLFTKALYEARLAIGKPVFDEDEFRWMRDWGFDFVRIPMDYLIWVAGDDPFAVEWAPFEHIDRVIRLGERYGLHVSLNLHNAPGYCINHPPTLLKNLWQDARALDAFKLHWSLIARRYQGLPADLLSFDLVNEPPNVAEGVMTLDDYLRVTRATAEAIRAIDPERLIIADGTNVGRTPVPQLHDPDGDLKLAQSTRAYDPHSISHYKAAWADGMDFPLPTWPQKSEVPPDPKLPDPWDRARLEALYAPWADLARQGVGVHCGEGGCFNHTPHAVYLRWFEDVLDILKGHNIGWALWNLTGAFGILDSQRADVDYVDWHGHRLDQKLLDLLRRY